MRPYQPAAQKMQPQVHIAGVDGRLLESGGDLDWNDIYASELVPTRDLGKLGAKFADNCLGRDFGYLSRVHICA